MVIEPQEKNVSFKLPDTHQFPEDWLVKPLKEEVFYQEGPGLRKWQFTLEGVKVINVTNLVGGKIDLSKTDRHISKEEVDKKYRHFLIDPLDIVVASSGNSWGKVAQVKSNHLPLLMNTSVIRFRPNDINSLSREYLYYFLSSKIFNRQIEKIITGSAQPNFGPYHLDRTMIPVPSVKEQKKIAEILSASDEQIEKTQQLIDKTKELKKGLIQRLLTKGINHTEFKNTDIGIVPEDWEIVELSEMATVIMGQAPPSTSYNESGEGLPFFQGRTEFGRVFPVTRKWCTSPSKIAEMNDVLISVRAPVGDVNMCEAKSCIGRGLGAIGAIEKVSDSWFLYYLLQSLKSRFNLLGQGSTFTAINGGELRKLMVIKPKYEEQKEIAEILLSVDEQLECYENEKEKQLELKNSLLQQLLTGKLRVTV